MDRVISRRQRPVRRPRSATFIDRLSAMEADSGSRRLEHRPRGRRVCGQIARDRNHHPVGGGPCQAAPVRRRALSRLRASDTSGTRRPRATVRGRVLRSSARIVTQTEVAMHDQRGFVDPLLLVGQVEQPAQQAVLCIARLVRVHVAMLRQARRRHVQEAVEVEHASRRGTCLVPVPAMGAPFRAWWSALA